MVSKIAQGERGGSRYLSGTHPQMREFQKFPHIETEGVSDTQKSGSKNSTNFILSPGLH
jgi:hypothetical protein